MCSARWRGEHDEIADLNLRFTPSLGVGYQRFESPNFNLFTKAGVAWVYEDFKNDGAEDHFVAIIGSFFAEFKFELRYDSIPAPGAKKEDLRYIVGVGWSF